MALDFDMLVSGVLTLITVAIVIGIGANSELSQMNDCLKHPECVEVHYDKL